LFVKSCQMDEMSKVNKCIWMGHKCPLNRHILPIKNNESNFLKCLFDYIKQNYDEKYIDRDNQVFYICELERIIKVFSCNCKFLLSLPESELVGFIVHIIDNNKQIFGKDFKNVDDWKETTIIMIEKGNLIKALNKRKVVVDRIKKNWKEIVDKINDIKQRNKQLIEIKKVTEEFKNLDSWLNKYYLDVMDKYYPEIENHVLRIRTNLLNTRIVNDHISSIINTMSNATEAVRDFSGKGKKRILVKHKCRRNSGRLFHYKKTHPPPVKLRRYHWKGSNQELRQHLGKFYPKCKYEKIFDEVDKIIECVDSSERYCRKEQTVVRLINIEADWLKLPKNIINKIKNCKFITLRANKQEIQGRIDSEYGLVYGEGIGNFLISNGFITPGMVLSLSIQDNDIIVISSIDKQSEFTDIDYWTLEGNKPVRKTIPKIIFLYKIVEDIFRSEMLYREIIPIDKGILTVMYEEMEEQNTFPNGISLTDREIFDKVKKKRPVSMSAVRWMLYLMDCFCQVSSNTWLLRVEPEQNSENKNGSVEISTHTNGTGGATIRGIGKVCFNYRQLMNACWKEYKESMTYNEFLQKFRQIYSQNRKENLNRWVKKYGYKLTKNIVSAKINQLSKSENSFIAKDYNVQISFSEGRVTLNEIKITIDFKSNGFSYTIGIIPNNKSVILEFDSSLPNSDQICYFAWLKEKKADEIQHLRQIFEILKTITTGKNFLVEEAISYLNRLIEITLQINKKCTVLREYNNFVGERIRDYISDYHTIIVNKLNEYITNCLHSKMRIKMQKFCNIFMCRLEIEGNAFAVLFKHRNYDNTFLVFSKLSKAMSVHKFPFDKEQFNKYFSKVNIQHENYIGEININKNGKIFDINNFEILTNLCIIFMQSFFLKKQIEKENVQPVKSTLQIKGLTEFEAAPLDFFTKNIIEPYVKRITSTEFLRKYKIKNPQKSIYCLCIRKILNDLMQQDLIFVDFKKYNISFSRKKLGYSSVWARTIGVLEKYGFRKKRKGVYCIDIKVPVDINYDIEQK